MWKITTPQNVPQPIQSLSTTALMPVGSVVTAVDGIHGTGEFVYLAGVASTVAGDLVTYNPFTGATTRGAATANDASPIAFATSPCVAGNFGWYQISGVAYANNNATAAAGNAFTKATAQVGSAAVAGTQILGGCRILVANGTTFTKTGKVTNGSTLLVLPDLDGLYVGLPVSGTGIPGSTTIAAGNDSGPNAFGSSAGSSQAVVMSAAGTADGTVTVTFTRTNISLVGGNRYFGQGQIT